VFGDNGDEREEAQPTQGQAEIQGQLQKPKTAVKKIAAAAKTAAKPVKLTPGAELPVDKKDFRGSKATIQPASAPLGTSGWRS